MKPVDGQAGVWECPRHDLFAQVVEKEVADGLERGDPSALRDAVAKLSRRAWRLSWLTPLASGPGFQPQTEALIAIRRFVNDLVDGGSTAAIVSHVLSLGQRKAA
jgi:uncharacterized protein with von Willebrand factor type A (vWA) domain